MNNQEIKLHLGCGERYLPGFCHIDIRKFPHIDYVASIDKLDMFEDDSVNLIYASHLLEHFSRNKTEEVLKEWHRVLKRGGIIRLAVPDFEKLINVYQETKDIKLILGPLFGKQDYLENTHYMVFDYNLLSEVLEKVGFKNIRKWD